MKTLFNLTVVLLLSLLSLNLSAQNKLAFPVDGKYAVIKEEGSKSTRYDKVSFQGDLYSLIKEDKSLFTFKIVSEEKGIYVLEQILIGDKPTSNIDKFFFSMKFELISGNGCTVSLIYPNRVEKLKLAK